MDDLLLAYGEMLEEGEADGNSVMCPADPEVGAAGSGFLARSTTIIARRMPEAAGALMYVLALLFCCHRPEDGDER